MVLLFVFKIFSPAATANDTPGSPWPILAAIYPACILAVLIVYPGEPIVWTDDKNGQSGACYTARYELSLFLPALYSALPFS